ncbi:hypothetical protein Q5752_004572 [Cryptotrichosporon argae]
MTAPPKAPGDRIQVMVVGLGMVGIAFIEKMLTLDVAGRYFIRTCGEEPHYAYNRVGLTEYFAHRNIADLYLNDVSWYAAQNPDHFAFHLSEQVVAIDHTAKVVRTSNGHEYAYAVLVLATGSAADLPPYISAERANSTRGVFVYRSIADLEAIIKYAERPEVKRASVVGGGLLGLEAAKAVYDMKVPDVSILIRQKYPLNRQLDAPAGALVLSKIEALGVRVLTEYEPRGIVTRTCAEDGQDVFAGFETADDQTVEADMTIFAIGIKPRDDLARASGIQVAARGGVEVGDDLQSSVEGVYAIGECASWRGNVLGRDNPVPVLTARFYGLISPGIEMADILAFNLTQTTGVAAHHPRKMNSPDLSTRLKLMGVDVASFGDYFADRRAAAPTPAPEPSHGPADGEVAHRPRPSKHRVAEDDAVRCLTYHDPFSATYKKYIFTADGQHLVGGMMIGDVDDFAKLVAITKKKKKLDVPPSEFILGAKKEGADNGDDLDDDAVVCSCHAVTKGTIVSCVKKDGVTDLAAVKGKTKATSGCGGCAPLVTSLFKAGMKRGGHAVNNHICAHFKMSRTDLFQAVKVKKLKDFRDVMDALGLPGSLGCESCNPAVASILSSINNDHVMKVEHHGSQDTNDRYLGNIQRNGTFSVVPRIPGGEIHPDKLLAIAEVAKEFGLYTKITGGQRIDLFGAHKADLPDIWTRLHAAGLESGHAYGKSLRTVKSCVGTTWCRFGVGDAVGLAIDLENRYRGVRSPHKFKGGVSGCVRECAEAQSKDFGLIAGDKGWTIYIGGNGGATPRHAQILAQDVPPTKVVQLVDRYLMFYIQTADRLMRTARWVESFDGGIEKLRRILVDDELGICVDLEAQMEALVGTYEDEWKRAVEDPELRAKFRQFANTDERRAPAEMIEERGQRRAADWPKNYPPEHFAAARITTPKSAWTWVPLLKTSDLRPNDKNTTSAAVLYGAETQLAVFRTPRSGRHYASQQMCPHKRAFVLSDGIVGDGADGKPYVSCPLHKRNYKLDVADEGACSDSDFQILTFDVKEHGDDLLLLLPPAEELDALLGTNKWMVKQATSEALGLNAATAIEIVGPTGQRVDEVPGTGGGCADAGCGDKKLEW